MLEIYADESSTSNNRYAVIGGVVISSDSRAYIQDRLANLYARFDLKAELKWQKTHHSHYIAYRSLIDETLDLMTAGRLHFHAVIIDSHQVWGDRNVGHAKFVYQLLMKFGRLYAPSQNLAIYLDAGNLKTPLPDLRSMLNAGIAKNEGLHQSPFKIIEAIDSKTERLLHVNDLLIGAISFEKNERHLQSDSRQAKRKLAEHVRSKTRISNLGNDFRRGNRISIWNFMLQKKHHP